MRKKTDFNLKLLALNDDDLKVLSAHLQDSVVLVKDIIFLKKSRTFLMMVNRFMWEDIELGVFRENKRIRCAVKFENVLEVKSRNISQKKKDKILELLSIDSEVKNNKKELLITFAGNNEIILIVEEINILLDDVGLPWKVKHVPKHQL
jgi:hypothetical protein|tara:strand:+ start:771 stop:1217 length:447 start_codon:yes stop_codon:yes gene_type:complete